LGSRAVIADGQAAGAASAGVRASLQVAASAATIWLAVQAGWFLATGHGRHRVESAGLLFGATWLLAISNRTRLPVAPEPSNRSTPAVAVLLCAVIAIVFAAAVRAGLLSDDYSLVSGFAICGRPVPWEFFRPIPVFLWHAIADAAGPRTGIVLHLASLGIHAVNAALVYRLLAHAGCTTTWAAGGAVLFAIWPLTAEPVVWISGIYDLIVTLAALAYIALAATGTRGAWRATIPLIIALGSKELAVVLPLLWIVWGAGTGRLRRTAVPIGVHIALCGGYALWRVTLGGSSEVLPSEIGGLVVKNLIVRPFAALVLPFTAGQLAAWSAGLLVVYALVLTSAVLLVWTRPSATPALAWRGALWILVASIPAGQLLFVGPELEGSRYLYLPSVGLAVIAAAAAQDLSAIAGRRTVLAALVAIALSSALVLRANVSAWSSAARERDRVLASFDPARSPGGAPPDAFDLPDRVGGAYVFRNGFPEAIAWHFGCDALARIEPRLP